MHITVFDEFDVPIVLLGDIKSFKDSNRLRYRSEFQTGALPKVDIFLKIEISIEIFLKYKIFQYNYINCIEIFRILYISI